MANNFKSGRQASIGTSNVAVYTTPAATKSILIELDVANRTADSVTVSVGIGEDAATSPDTYIIKDVVIPTGDSLQVVSGQKIVLDGTTLQQKVFVVSSVAASVDAIASVLEGVQ